MMISAVSVPILLGIFSLAWLVTSPLRRPRKLEELLAKLRTDLADRLMPCMEGQYYVSDRSLQEAIGGWRGVSEMHKQAGYVASIAHALADGPIKQIPELEEIVLETIYLRIITPFCLVEMFFHNLFALLHGATSTKLRVPRVSSWGYARLYCDMVSSIIASIADSGALDGAHAVPI